MIKFLTVLFRGVQKQVLKTSNMSNKNIFMGGFTAPGFEKCAQTFRANLASGLERGGNFAAYYKGRLVVNLWGGYSDYDCRRTWKEDTLSTFFSSTKAVAALVIAHMVDRGVLDYDKPVSLYWPDFAQNGKDKITLKQLISNQGGLITLSQPFWLSELRDDPQGLGRKLAEQKPYWTPGEKHGYHPLTFGLYLDQVVRHADSKGRSLAQYFQDEIAKPFNLELYIGLPKELYHRSTRVVMARELDQAQLLAKFKGEIELLMKTGNNPQDFKTTLKVNDPDNRELPVPSTHGHATAANFAKLFGIVANGGQHEGQTLLSSDVIRKFTEPIVAGYDVSFGINAAWSLGTHLITQAIGNQTLNHIFGHGGYGGQYAAADIRHKVGFAYTTPFLDPFSSYADDGDQRMYSLYESLYDCVWKVEGITEPRRTFRFYSDLKKYQDERGLPSKL